MRPFIARPQQPRLEAAQVPPAGEWGEQLWTCTQGGLLLWVLSTCVRAVSARL